MINSLYAFDVHNVIYYVKLFFLFIIYSLFNMIELNCYYNIKYNITRNTYGEL